MSLKVLQFNLLKKEQVLATVAVDALFAGFLKNTAVGFVEWLHDFVSRDRDSRVIEELVFLDEAELLQLFLSHSLAGVWILFDLPQEVTTGILRVRVKDLDVEHHFVPP